MTRKIQTHSSLNNRQEIAQTQQFVLKILNDAIGLAQITQNQNLIENKYPEQTVKVLEACYKEKNYFIEEDKLEGPPPEIKKILPEQTPIVAPDFQDKDNDFYIKVSVSLKNLLMSPFPSGGLALLKENGVLDGLFPEYGRLYGVPQVEIYHPEIDTGIHLAMCLDYAAKVNMPWIARFAVFCHDFGKGITPTDILPHHYEHEIKGTDLVKDFCTKWNIGCAEKELALFVTEHHGTWHRVPESGDKKVVKFLLNYELDTREKFRRLVGLACIADSRGRLGLEHSIDHTAILFDKVCDAWKNINQDEQFKIAEQRFQSYLIRKEERNEQPVQDINYFLKDLIYRERISLVNQSRPKKNNSMSPC